MAETSNKAPSYDFKFNWDDVDPDIRRRANLRIAQLLTLAPPGAKVVGVMNREGKYYVTAVEVSSHYRSFYKKAIGSTPEFALSRVLERLEEFLYRWRYGGGSSDSEAGTQMTFNQTQTQ